MHLSTDEVLIVMGVCFTLTWVFMLLRGDSRNRLKADFNLALDALRRECDEKVGLVAGDAKSVDDELRKKLLNSTKVVEDEVRKAVKTLADQADASQREVLRVTIESVQSLSEDFKRDIEKSKEEVLQNAVRAVWNDMDGTLETVRNDFDASLNQRTEMLQELISKSSNGKEFKEVYDRGMDHHDRIAHLERRVDMIDSDVAELYDAPDEEEGQGEPEGGKPSWESADVLERLKTLVASKIDEKTVDKYASAISDFFRTDKKS